MCDLSFVEININHPKISELRNLIDKTTLQQEQVSNFTSSSLETPFRQENNIKNPGEVLPVVGKIAPNSVLPPIYFSPRKNKKDIFYKLGGISFLLAINIVGRMIRLGYLKFKGILKKLILTLKIVTDFLFLICILNPLLEKLIIATLVSAILVLKFIDQYFFNCYFSKIINLPILIIKNLINLFVEVIETFIINSKEKAVFINLKLLYKDLLNRLYNLPSKIYKDYKIISINYSNISRAKIFTWNFNIFAPLTSYYSLRNLLKEKKAFSNNLIHGFFDSLLKLAEDIKLGNQLKINDCKNFLPANNFKISMLWLENFLYNQDLELLSREVLFLKENYGALRNILITLQSDVNAFLPHLFNKENILDLQFKAFIKAISIIAVYLQASTAHIEKIEEKQAFYDEFFSSNSSEACYIKAYSYFVNNTTNSEGTEKVTRRLNALNIFFANVDFYKNSSFKASVKYLNKLHNVLHIYKSILEEKGFKDLNVEVLDKYFKPYLIDALYLLSCKQCMEVSTSSISADFYEAFEKDTFTDTISSKVEYMALETAVVTGHFSLLTYLEFSMITLCKELLDIKSLILAVYSFQILKVTKVDKVIDYIFEPFEKLKSILIKKLCLSSTKVQKIFSVLDYVSAPKDKTSTFCAFTSILEEKNVPVKFSCSNFSALEQLKFNLYFVGILVKYNFFIPFKDLLYPPNTAVNEITIPPVTNYSQTVSITY